ncbi:MAG TPA: PAS domain S-box protein, partial [Verrucomicrobiae bacterium]|nr:PAS domain S-box protein [Verrucomicrobiae bacterium]
MSDFDRYPLSPASAGLSAGQHSAILNALPAGIALVDTAGNILAVNKAWWELAESRGVVVSPDGRRPNYFDLFLQITGAGTAETDISVNGLREVLAGRQPRFVLEYPCLTGEPPRWFRMMATPARANDGEPGAVMMHVDITDRKRVECQLEAERNLLRAVVDHLPDYIYIKDADSRYLMNNRANVELMNAGTVANTLGKTAADFFPPDLARLYHEDDRRVMASGLPMIEREEPIVSSAGEQRWLLTTKVPVRDETGAVTGLVGISRDITQRRNAETELRESAANMAAAQRIAHFGSWELDLTVGPDAPGRLRWSDELFRIFGFAPGSVTPTTSLFYQVAHPADHELIRRAMETALRDHQPYSVVHRAIRPNGEERVVHETAQLVVDPASGRPLKLVGTTHDITEQRRADEALRQSEERFQLAVRGSDAGLWDVDLVTRKVYYAPRFKEMLGYSEDEFPAAQDVFIQFLHPDDRERWLTMRRRHLEERVPYDLDYRLLARNGEYRWFNSRGQASWDEQGKPYRMTGWIVDITGRKLAEARMREHAALLDQTQDAIMVRGLDDRLQYWNKGAERMFGWTAAEVAGRDATTFLHVDPERYNAAKKILLEQGEWGGELQKLTRTGRHLVIESRWTLMRDENGAPKSVLAIGTDMTDRKKLEAQFLRAQRMESIGTLAGGIAHDLNNVLSPIIMSIDFLAEREQEPAHLEVLASLRRSAQRGADMVRQVLSFARGVEGQRLVVQPRHLIREVAKIIQETFPKNITLHASISEQLWTVRGDPTQLHQVLLNLALNARDAMPGGGGLTLTAANIVLDGNYVAMNAQAKPGPHVVLEVADTGGGIAPEHQEKIFEPFFTTKEIGKGTGLGLSTALAIVKSHGGFVNFYSEPGKG